MSTSAFLQGILSHERAIFVNVVRAVLDDGIIHHRNQVPFESVTAAANELDESFGTTIDKLRSMDGGPGPSREGSTRATT